jgi:hypothetical protein
VERFKIARTASGCYRIDLDASRPGWTQDVLLRSDAHHDNAHSDHRLELLHLTEAVERDAFILDAGDLFCAMQGKWDKRASTDACRPEHREGRYLDSLVETAAEFYEPFADRWLLLAPGNHERSILKRHETCLTTRLAERFRTQGSQVEVGTYSGFIRIVADMGEGKTLSRVLYWTHGSGGGGPMTHGVLSTRRRQSYLPDADVVWSGHTHDSWCVRLAKASLVGGSIRLDDVHHVSTPGYKDEFTPMDGWHHERGAPPKPIGAVWLRLSIEQRSNPNRHRAIKVDVQEAR